MTRGRSLQASRYLRTLATIEKLSALGNDDEVRRLLAGVDPLLARELAAELEASPLILSCTGESARLGLVGSPAPLQRCI